MSIRRLTTAALATLALTGAGITATAHPADAAERLCASTTVAGGMLHVDGMSCATGGKIVRAYQKTRPSFTRDRTVTVKVGRTRVRARCGLIMSTSMPYCYTGRGGASAWVDGYDW